MKPWPASEVQCLKSPRVLSTAIKIKCRQNVWNLNPSVAIQIAQNHWPQHWMGPVPQNVWPFQVNTHAMTDPNRHLLVIQILPMVSLSFATFPNFWAAWWRATVFRIFQIFWVRATLNEYTVVGQTPGPRWYPEIAG